MWNCLLSHYFVVVIEFSLIQLFLLKFSELEQASALKYLYGWLQNHPKYGSLTSQVQMESLYHADVSLDGVIQIY